MMTTIPLPIAADHPAYAGHFPGRPILPGVVLLDQAQRALEQACGVTLTGLAQAKFLSPCVPGDALQLDYELSDTALRFDIRCGERRVASGRFTLAAAGNAA
jgi:3-hydroxymyristoyl/3-hydroxydecanoyl-(acyl carrier protein) dehydratase